MKRLALVLSVSILLCGCTSLLMGPSETRTSGVSSSLVDFLYPNGQLPPASGPELPTLDLPVRVGIAFVPSHHYALSASNQQDLASQVRAEFVGHKFVEDIVVIPQIYMRSTKGLSGVQQVSRMHNVDVIALISYDQLSLSGERDSSILYWTVVGALFVKGNSNEVHTLVDTAVFDVSSGRLLFRAPGQARDQANTTMLDASRDLRLLQTSNFGSATTQMIANLDLELQGFRENVKHGRGATVSWQPHSGGGGSTDFLLIGLLLLIAGGHLIVQIRKSSIT